MALLPVPWLHRMSGVSVVLPYYHMVSDESVPHVKHLYSYRNVRQFTQDLDFFLTHYEPITLHDLLGHLDGKKTLPKHCFLLTFDDGFREMHDVVAPILRAKGVPATFFLTSGFIDNADMAHHAKLSLLVEHVAQSTNKNLRSAAQDVLVRNQIGGKDFTAQMVGITYQQRHLVTELAALCGYDFAQYQSAQQPYVTSTQIRSLLQQGFTVGAHSLDHPLYAAVPLAEQLRQTRASMAFLIDRFQIDYRTFAFPHSDAGVAAGFFETLFPTGELAVSFGTRGMVPHFFPRNLERFSMEKTQLPARQVVAWQSLRGWRKAGRN